jgi:predicted MPP superfamily phosphohydrolase
MTRIEPHWLAVRYVTIRLPDLSPRFHDYRVAHISDLHMGGWLRPDRLEPVVMLVNQLRPDVIAITGDFVDHNPKHVAPGLTAALRALQAPDGVLAVLGNHDYRDDHREVRAILDSAGIINLCNDVQTITRGDSTLHFAGVDSVTMGRDNLDAVLDKLPDDSPALLLAHEPDYADISGATGRFAMQLSGHSHGGQVKLPLLGMPMLPQHGKRYPSGRYAVNGMTVYTNRGLGMTQPHVRFGARPELTIFILEAPR